MPRILSVNTGLAAPLFAEDGGERFSVSSAIRKRPVSTLDAPEPVEVKTLGLAGDEQADPSVHGGRDQAVYLYPQQHYEFWRTVRAQAKVEGPLEAGAMGENLTVEGLAETAIWVGDRLRIGDVELLVTRPRSPCFKFNARMGFRHAAKLMVQSGYTGLYCAVVRPGSIAAGAEIHVVPGERAITIEQMHRLQTRGRQRDLF